ncbi:hypothetical protein X747_32665 [Mesorhizobium sp. LNJC384A00]|nr:hypothetical protein X747_32665 [Mesorhizobium sp. LNJC384A00]ESY29437.1 hypothetical protein X749_15950 [Mesorhizobium sp. LNJC391B00]
MAAMDSGRAQLPHLFIFPRNIAEIRGLWARNLEIARDNDVTLSPQKFAEMFVDENFENDGLR